MSFHFVDQIVVIDAERARGRLVRTGGGPLPAWLIIEAVGQLAGWIAMRRTDFARRPVAALAGEIRLGGESSGEILLDAHIERLDARAILYNGTARCADAEVAGLSRCVGPLLPLELFDDADAIRHRFAMLSASPPAAPGTPYDSVHFDLSPTAIDGDTISSQLQVPAEAPFFADHFPRRPVYPASLLAAALSQFGAPLAARLLDVSPKGVRLARLLDYKLRSFSPPGQALELHGESRGVRDQTASIAVNASAEGKRVAGCVLEYRCGTPRPT